MHKKLLLGLIGTIIAGHAFAETTTQTIPTQSYVDTNFQTKIPAGTHGENNSVVTYGANAGDVQERLIIDSTSDDWWSDDVIKNYIVSGVLMDDSTKMFGLYSLNATDEQYENALLPAKYINYGFKRKQYAITPGTTGSVAIFDGADSRGGSKFTERAIYDGSTTYDSSTDADKLITAGAVDNKQNKMTCTRWLDNAEHTDENCLLWQLNN